MPTEVEPCYTWIMITNLIIVALPRIQVQMLIQRATSQRATHKHMVQCLAVHVEQVRVAFRDRHASQLVEINEARL